MNRGRHKNGEQERKKKILLTYGAKNLEKWKHFTLNELEQLITETIKQQVTRNYILATKFCDLSTYENNYAACRSRGGIDWDKTNKSFYECQNILHKLIE